MPRWHVVVGASLSVAAVGVWSLTPVLLVAAMVPLGFVAYGAVTTATVIDDRIRVTRSVTPARTHPGGVVGVEIAVEHVGDGPVPDLRIVDGVPDALSVVEGSPRAALGLHPEETATLEYAVRARSGEFSFSEPRVRTTSLSGVSTYTTTVEADGDDRISARFGADASPVSDRTTGMVGTLTADSGGEGVTFYGTREYRPGDPMSRIDWRQYAERRELTTVDYRQQEAIEAVVVVDARAAAAVAADETAPTGVELSAHAANEAIDGLVTTHNRVGVVTLEDGGAGDREFGWVAPGSGPDHRSRLRAELNRALDIERVTDATGPAEGAPDPGTESGPVSGSGSVPPSAGRAERRSSAAARLELAELVDRLTPRAQVIVFTPLCDAVPADVTRTLQAAGHDVSVCTPNVTTTTTAGMTLAGIERASRCAALRTDGVTVIDWEPTDRLTVVLERVARSMTARATVET